MTLKLKTIQDGLYDWIKEVLPTRTIIFYHPNAPRPALPYLTIYIRNVNKIGWDWQGPIDEDGDTYLNGIRSIMVEINAYGDASFDDVQKLINSLRQQNVMDILACAGLSFVNLESSEDITELLDTKYERRYFMEAMFYAPSQDQDNIDKYNIGFVSKISGDVIVKNEAGEMIKKQEFEAPEDE